MDFINRYDTGGTNNAAAIIELPITNKNELNSEVDLTLKITDHVIVSVDLRKDNSNNSVELESLETTNL